MFTKEENKRYFKQMILPEFGLNGQVALKNAKVAVIGAGGLGCPILQYLAACGIGKLGIIDFDTVDISNLHRQILYTEADLGQSKAILAQKRILAQNPHTQTEVHQIQIQKENAEQLLSQYDIVVDGCDNFLTRYVVNDVCVKLGKPLIYGSILGFEGQLAVFNFNGSKNLRDLFPEPPNAEDVPSCSANGVLGTVPGIIGTMMAQLTIQVIIEKEVPTNCYRIVDTLNFKSVSLEF